MGFISSNHARILHNNSLINLHTIDAGRQNGVKRYLYTSSACIYPEYRQRKTNCTPLKEEDAYPAEPQDAYGWEKLISERLCIHYREEYGLETRIVRFHNIFGPLGTWDGGREKAPAAMCRKVATAKVTGSDEIEIWGDGEQTRSFCYIDDCVTGLFKLMRSDYIQPLNLGQDRVVTINELADMVAALAGVQIRKKHIAGPQGVRGRNSDNTRLREVLGWEPQTSLEDGLDWREPTSGLRPRSGIRSLLLLGPESASHLLSAGAATQLRPENDAHVLRVQWQCALTCYTSQARLVTLDRKTHIR